MDLDIDLLTTIVADLLLKKLYIQQMYFLGIQYICKMYIKISARTLLKALLRSKVTIKRTFLFFQVE